MKELIPGMVKRKWGRIVNIGTGAAKTPAEVRILSGGPRAALVNYSVAVSKKVARHNVAINNILPGMHHTATTGTTYQKLAEKMELLTTKRSLNLQKNGEYQLENLVRLKILEIL